MTALMKSLRHEMARLWLWGIGDDSMLIASDPHALTPHTRRVIFFLNDGEYAHIHLNDVNIRRIDGAESSTNIEFLEEEWGTGEKGLPALYAQGNP